MSTEEGPIKREMPASLRKRATDPAFADWRRERASRAGEASHAKRSKAISARLRRIAQVRLKADDEIGAAVEKPLRALLSPDIATPQSRQELRKALLVAAMTDTLDRTTLEIATRLLDSASRDDEPSPDRKPTVTIEMSWQPVQEPSATAGPPPPVPLAPVAWTGEADLTRKAIGPAVTPFLAPPSPPERPADLTGLAVEHLSGFCSGASCACRRGVDEEA